MNILIIQLLRLGDAVQIIPIVHGLKKYFPMARIHMLASTLGKSIFDMEPLVEKTFVLRKETIAAQARRGRPEDLTAALQMLQADLAPLFDVRWDWVVNFSFSFPSALIGFLLDAGQVSGYTVNKQRQYFSKEKWFAHSLASFCHRRYSNFNWVDINKRIVELPGVPSLPLLTVDPQLENLAKQHLQSLDFLKYSIIAIHPGASNNIKTWPLENFVEFARIMIDRHDYRVLILGGEDEIRSGNSLQNLLGAKAHDLTGRTTLEQLKAYLKNCNWLVGNDTGPMHLAAALGTKTLALFFNSHFVETGVYAGDHIALHPDLPCFPCQGPARCAAKECLKHVKPQTVEKLIMARENNDTVTAFSLEADGPVKAYLSSFDLWGMLAWKPLFRLPLDFQDLERLLLKTAWMLHTRRPFEAEGLDDSYLATWLGPGRSFAIGAECVPRLETLLAEGDRLKALLIDASASAVSLQKELMHKKQNVAVINQWGRRLTEIENLLAEFGKESCLIFVNELLAVFRENIEQSDLPRLARRTVAMYAEMIRFLDGLMACARKAYGLLQEFDNSSYSGNREPE